MTYPLAINFLACDEFDQNKNLASEYRKFTPEQWDCQHNVIQWAFPTKTASAFNPGAPVLPEDWEFNWNDRVHRHCAAVVLQLLAVYLKTLGIKIDEFGRFWLDTSGELKWFEPGDHNFRRFTRIIECLKLFGQSDVAAVFADFLIYDLAVTYPNIIDARSLAYWVAARDNKLHVLHR